MNYTFKCQKCEIEFELEMTMTSMEKGEAICVACSSKEVKRVYKPLNRVGIRYKGNAGEGDGRKH